MTEEIINDELVLTVPDDFKILNTQEIILFTRKSAKDNFVIRNIEKHSAVDIAWSKTNFINRRIPVAKMTSITKDNIKKANPTFKMQDNVKAEIVGCEAEGFRYTYKAKKNDVIGEYLLIKCNNSLYSFTFISNAELFDENYLVYEEFLKNVKLKA